MIAADAATAASQILHALWEHIPHGAVMRPLEVTDLKDRALQILAQGAAVHSHDIINVCLIFRIINGDEIIAPNLTRLAQAHALGKR